MKSTINYAGLRISVGDEVACYMGAMGGKVTGIVASIRKDGNDDAVKLTTGAWCWASEVSKASIVLAPTDRVFMYRSGNGNEGNYPRHLVVLTAEQDAHAALKALLVNGFIPRRRTRRHVVKHVQVDGEVNFGVNATVYEGPKGQQAFGAAWLTAELEPLEHKDVVEQMLSSGATLRYLLDPVAWRLYKKEAS